MLLLGLERKIVRLVSIYVYFGRCIKIFKNYWKDWFWENFNKIFGYNFKYMGEVIL